MGVIHYRILFQGELPAIATVLEQLELLTGLEVTYDEEKWDIRCARLEVEFALYPGDNNDYYITSFNIGYFFNMGSKRSAYLEQATVHALQALGGTYAYELSPWAREPWKIAKKHF